MEVEEAHLTLLQQAVLSSEALVGEEVAVKDVGPMLHFVVSLVVVVVVVEEVAVKVVELILHFVASLVVVVEVVALALAVAG